MFGGEMAAETALMLDRREADGRDAWDLGWVTDWLYGDAVLPSAPLPPREPLLARQPALHVHAEPPIHAAAPAAPRTPARRRRRRGSRQLALL